MVPEVMPKKRSRGLSAADTLGGSALFIPSWTKSYDQIVTNRFLMIGLNQWEQFETVPREHLLYFGPLKE